jgi:hypothetical protein
MNYIKNPEKSNSFFKKRAINCAFFYNPSLFGAQEKVFNKSLYLSTSLFEGRIPIVKRYPFLWSQTFAVCMYLYFCVCKLYLASKTYTLDSVPSLNTNFSEPNQT